MGSVPGRAHFISYHSFFLLSFSSLFLSYSNSSTPFPCITSLFFLLFFSHSFSSSSFFFFLYFPLFFSSPICCFSFLAFLHLLFSWLLPPFPLLMFMCVFFSSFNHFFLFLFISPLYQGGYYNRLNKAKG